MVDVFKNKPNAKEAITISSVLGVPLHPFFTFFWENLSLEEFLSLRKWLFASETKIVKRCVTEIIGVNDKLVKLYLEKLCIPHEVILRNLKIILLRWD